MRITIDEKEIKIELDVEDDDKRRRMIEFILEQFPNDYQDKEPFRQPSKETKILKFE